MCENKSKKESENNEAKGMKSDPQHSAIHTIHTGHQGTSKGLSTFYCFTCVSTFTQKAANLSKVYISIQFLPLVQSRTL